MTAPEGARTLTGVVDHIIYENQDNAYTVFILTPEEDGPEEDDSGSGQGSPWEDEDEICVVGNLPGITAGETVRLSGAFVDHETYGRQFKASFFEQIAPRTRQAMIRYLGSGAIKGVRRRLAEKIVKKFGKDTFRIIEEEPERLAQISGISMNKAMDIADQMVDRREQRSVLIYLDSLGLTVNMALRVFAAYGAETKRLIEQNPYRLADEIEGFGFHAADEMALKLGFREDDDFRVDSGVLHTLSEAAGQGHTYLPAEELLGRAQELLHVSRELLDESVMRQYLSGRVVRKREAVYLKRLYRAESGSADLLHRLSGAAFSDVSEEEVLEALARIEREDGLFLDEIQKKAVYAAAAYGVSILTGGPGTGKTTTLSAMIRYFELHRMEIALAAPTGRAAKRMSEATDREAKTIHRLLEVSGRPGENGSRQGFFDRDEDNPLECDVLIVDEASMVDISLLYSLLRAVPRGCRLIFVGDVNQLPSVGPGNVLADLIGSGSFAVVRLEKIFRQAGASDIVVNAHKINAGEHFPVDNHSKDFFFSRCRDSEAVIAAMLKYLKGKLPAYVGADRLEIQILTPTRKGNLGVERLNGILQENLNPPGRGKAEHRFGSRILREGDKVMQVRNNYQQKWEVRGRRGVVVEDGEGVFNGDMGLIREISEYDKTVVVEFDDGRVAEYEFGQEAELEHAYAVTIHKSQGSEYPAVLIPMLRGPRPLMNRNLVYTAVTRAKKCVCMVGDEQVFWEMVDSVWEGKRYSGLKDRLEELQVL